MVRAQLSKVGGSSLADFDAETRFELRAARGRGRVSHGLALLDKAMGKRGLQLVCHESPRSGSPAEPEF